MTTQNSPTRIFDPKRLEALRKTYMLDTKAEEAFDRLTSLSARVLGAPVSLVSLIETERQFMKSVEGIEEDIIELPLSHSFCKHVVATGKPLIVEDSREHPLVKDNAAIDDFGVMAYLGMPLRTSDGYDLGALCVIDVQPREWSEDEIKMLNDLSASVIMEIELRVKMRMEEEAGRKLSKTDLYGELSDDKKSFGVYEVVNRIGSGGMADVYMCEHKILKTAVAVKELRRTAKDQYSFIERFEQEAKIISNLKHPNIVRVFDYGLENDSPYMVMEYIHGVELGEFMERFDRMTFDQDGDILLDIAQALDYAHGKGIIHRDIKPENVMLRRRFRDGKPTMRFHATLMDFGIAKITSTESNLTQDNLVGTLNYMAPEQIENSHDIDHRADIYGLGVLAYQFLTGHLPFETDSFGAVINMHLNTPIPDPKHFAPDLTENQVHALHKALAKNPDDRFNTATEFVTMLGK